MANTDVVQLSKELVKNIPGIPPLTNPTFDYSKFEKSQNSLASADWNTIISRLLESINILNDINAIEKFTKYINDAFERISNANDILLLNSTTKAGEINKNPQLHGFIFEDLHAQIFNIKAEQAGKNFYAMVERPLDGLFKENSVDITIRDKQTNQILHKYCAKCCQSAEDTLKAIKAGDYRGQRLLVPSEQAKTIRGTLSPERTVATKLAYDGIEGRELSYSEAKKYQYDLQNGIKDIITQENIDKFALFKQQLISLANFYLTSFFIRSAKVAIDAKKNNLLPNYQTFVDTIKESAKDTVIPAITSVLDYISTIKDWGFEKLDPSTKYGIIKVTVSAAESVCKIATNQSSVVEESKNLAKEIIVTSIDTAGGHIAALGADSLVTIAGHPEAIPLVHESALATGMAITHTYSPELADKIIDYCNKYKIGEKIESTNIYLKDSWEKITNSTANLFNLSSN